LEQRTSPPAAREPSERDLAIEQFSQRWFAGHNEDLYAEMLLTLCRLAKDEATRGDVKLLHKALAELRYGLKVFAPYRTTHKISIFGSSRTPEGHPDYEAAHEFARRMCAVGWMVITGAGDGIMKAGHGGAGREASFGVAIRLPFEQKTNTIIADDRKLVNFRYFFTRKLIFMKECSAVALFPGGFGTQDEGFEALTLVQTGKAPIIPIVMVEQPGGTYWQQWRAYVAAELLRTGMISPEDMHLFRITDSIDAAAEHVLKFYRVYHSMRYVGDELVVRLQRPLRPSTVEMLNDRFAKLVLMDGQFAQRAVLPEEKGEFPQLPRLTLRFNKRAYGTLRRVIDAVNDDPGPEESTSAVA
jgi:uncharacterized protein (TIGR00730 family)